MKRQRKKHQNVSLNAAGFFSLNMKTYLVKLIASMNSNYILTKECRRTVLALQIISGNESDSFW
jgi:hypothetical protein